MVDVIFMLDADENVQSKKYCESVPRIGEFVKINFHLPNTTKTNYEVAGVVWEFDSVFCMKPTVILK